MEKINKKKTKNNKRTINGVSYSFENYRKIQIIKKGIMP